MAQVRIRRPALSAKQKKVLRELGPVLFGLAYHADAEREPMPRMLWDVRWPHIKKAIEKELLQHSR